MKDLNVALIGYGFMGKAHSQAWRNVSRFFEIEQNINLKTICGRNENDLKKVQVREGWQDFETDWRKIIDDPNVDVIDICTSGDSHAEIAIAALNANKHVLCEKPLANTVAQAAAMTQAAEKSKGKSMVGFNYRLVPAISFAKELVQAGKVGRIFHIRARYLQDWIVDPKFELVWRLQKDLAGSGALGDIAAHIVDMTQFVTGQKLTGVSALTHTFITERPLVNSTQMGDVTVDDAAIFFGKTDHLAIASYEATRFAAGSRNDFGFEIYGDKGSLKFNFEQMSYLQFCDNTEAKETTGFKNILVTEPNHPYMKNWWPPGHHIGYGETFTHQIYDFVTAIKNNTAPTPSFADGWQIQKVLAAVESSAQNNSVWTLI
jgi:predicted dehydrogenase